METNCFYNLHELRCIQLHNNLITIIQSTAFHNLSSLHHINVSNNLIFKISLNVFSNTPQLNTLSIKNNKMTQIHPLSLRDSKIKFIETNKYKLCCVMPQDCKCTTDIPWYKSCTNLLPNLRIRNCFVGISLLVDIFSLACIIVHFQLEQFNSCFWCYCCNKPDGFNLWNIFVYYLGS